MARVVFNPPSLPLLAWPDPKHLVPFHKIPSFGGFLLIFAFILWDSSARLERKKKKKISQHLTTTLQEHSYQLARQGTTLHRNPALPKRQQRGAVLKHPQMFSRGNFTNTRAFDCDLATTRTKRGFAHLPPPHFLSPKSQVWGGRQGKAASPSHDKSWRR